MGTWGCGPFDNDASIDVFREAPSRAVAKALREIAKTPPGKLIEANAGGVAWAACELVALAFGYGNASVADDAALDAAAKLTPKEKQRQLALVVLVRIGERATSEIAALWHEGEDGASFDGSLEDLRSRLEAARAGPRPLPKAKPGDVIGLPAAPGTGEMIVVQVVGPGEVAVIEGVYDDEEAALASTRNQPATRVPSSLAKLLRRGRLLGNESVRRDLKGRKLYAGEAGTVDEYLLATANGGAARAATYEGVRDCDVLRPYEEADLRAVALGTLHPPRVESPDDREAKLAARVAPSWAERRNVTTPGPFGDVASLMNLLEWMEAYGSEYVVGRFHEQALGRSVYGRPNYFAERRAYAFAGIVAVWRSALPLDTCPESLRGRFPKTPIAPVMERAVTAGRILASRVITRDADLRMTWHAGPDRGAGLEEAVAALIAALA